jgi:hypothetical protein
MEPGSVSPTGIPPSAEARAERLEMLRALLLRKALESQIVPSPETPAAPFNDGKGLHIDIRV